VFAAVALAFVSATALTNYRTTAIDRAASVIATNTAPAIEALATARGASRHLSVLLRERLTDDANATSREDEIVRTHASLDETLAAYFDVTPLPNELSLWPKMRDAQAGLDAGIPRILHLIHERDMVAARTFLEGPLLDDFSTLSDAVGDAIELNAKFSGDLAFQIRQERKTSARLAALLDVGCVVLTLLATILLLKSMRSYAALLERHRMIEAERVVELEQFAGRIAHDILSPIGTVALAMEMADRVNDPGQKKRALDRGRSSIARVKRLVDGLLGFARAGARPEPGAHTAVEPVIVDVVDDSRIAAEEAAVQVEIDTSGEIEVACTAGVLTSLIANLLRNALKYAAGAERRVVLIRAFARPGTAHVEVVDHGPGLDPDVAGHAFEPFLRGKAAKGASIGLGLATVRKLTMAHGGMAGVRATPGGGCTFWFELPTHPLHHGTPGEDSGTDSPSEPLPATT
jgi:signal transduction histidine kinase